MVRIRGAALTIVGVAPPGFFGETVILLALGAALGAGAAMALARIVAASMYGVSTADPLTIAVAAATLTVVALAAASFPALRAARIDPIVALRVE